MNDFLKEALEKIEARQPKERTPVWMVGEQLKDILRGEPHLAEMVCQDLDNKKMSLRECEKEIKAFADKNRKNNFSCVIPSEAEEIIRKFYGLHLTELPKMEPFDGNIIDLSRFM